MSTSEQHRDKAANNEFLRDQLNNPFWDWAVTVTFYAALHYVEAYFAKKKPALHSKDHKMRDSYIRRDAVLGPLYRKYVDLKQESHDARYQAHIVITQSDVTRVQPHLEAIKKALLPLIT